MKDIIQKLKKAQLHGRGGAGFLTNKKWEIFQKAPGKKKYVICNASEGDPQMSKDGYLLQNHLSEVVEGFKVALETFPEAEGYFYLRKDYYRKFKGKLLKLTKDLPVNFFKKPGHYLAGEETSLLEAIEGKVPEPRLKPPYPCEAGLFGKPTLVNNVETFYFVGKIANHSYNNERFYCLNGDLPHKGVHLLKDGLTIKEVLEKTSNVPDFDFFVQAGGTLGEFLLKNELNKPFRGLASVVVYHKKFTNSLLLAKKILSFAMHQNCDKCTPCREGMYRLFEQFIQDKPDKQVLEDIFQVLEETTFCPLGMLAGNAVNSLYQKLINEKN